MSTEDEPETPDSGTHVRPEVVAERARRDAEARHRIATEIDTTFLVEAAAGTGKTTALIARIVESVRQGRALDRMAAVTFTDKAAGELRLRLREELERARHGTSDAAVRRHLLAGVRALEGAAIGTIHSFCLDLLRQRPVEAVLDPDFELIDQEDADALADRAFDQVFRASLQDPPEGIRRVLCLRRWGSSMSSPSELLRGAARTLVSHRDFDATWARPPFDRAAAMEAVLDAARGVAPLATICQQEDDYLRQSFEVILEVVAAADARAEARARRRARGDDDGAAHDEDRLEAELRALRSHRAMNWKGRGRKYGTMTRDEAKALRDGFRDRLDAFVDAAERDLAACLQLELSAVLGVYEALKRQAGVIDFLDVLSCTRDLLVSNPDVRNTLRERFDHVYVDEFQDTDPVQAEILVLLCSTEEGVREGPGPLWTRLPLVPGKLFTVGDPKQAIYRFRRADVAVYEKVRAAVLDAGGEVLELSKSFRAVPSIQAMVNGTFEPIFGSGEPGVQAAHVPLGQAREERTDGLPGVVALPIPSVYGERDYPQFNAIEESTPDAVAAYVHWLLRKSGYTTGPDARRLEASDVCLLFTRMASSWKDHALPYVRALEARGIAHVAHAGRSLHDREEIHGLRRVLAAVEWPDDELEVYAVLRGPFIGFYDEDLLRYVNEVGRLQPFPDAPRTMDQLPEFARPIAEVLDLLAELHLMRNRQPVADTLDAWLSATRAHAGLAFRAGPRQALAGVAHLLDRARVFETHRATSFRAFVEWLEQEAEQPSGVGATGGAGVRLMTVHKAKGLEWPVVILCDPTAKADHGYPSRYVDADRRLWATSLCNAAPAELLDHAEEVLKADAAERKRVLYVAATRARDLLVVPIVGDRPDGKFSKMHLEDRWLAPLWSALYPPAKAVPKAAPGCFEPVGGDTVLARPDLRWPPTKTQAGRHTSELGLDVVWWNPAALALSLPPRTGMAREKLLAGGPQTQRTERSRATLSRWLEVGAKTRARASAPSAPAETVRTRALAHHEPGEVVTLQTGAWREDRPRGARFGTLVHAVLAEIPFDAEAPIIHTLARTHARLLGATDAEVEAAAQSVGVALKHPIFERAAASPNCRREVAVTNLADDGVVIEGVVDLAFLEDDPFGDSVWTVVDYKTDLGAGAPPEYVAQVRLYATAIAEATGLPTEAVLLAV